MNIKRNIFAVLAAAVLLASCGQDEVMTDTGHDGLVPVTLSAAVGDGVQTRTVDADNDEKPTRCYVQAFTTADNGKTLTLAPGDLASPLDMGDPTAEGTSVRWIWEIRQRKGLSLLQTFTSTRMKPTCSCIGRIMRKNPMTI